RRRKAVGNFARATVRGARLAAPAGGSVMVVRVASALVGAVLLLSAVPARAASWLEMNFYLSGPRYDGVVPPCEAGLDTIASRFSTKESGYWNSALTIDA